ncbi:ATP-dependent Clp protease ATP-binding subunit ClpA [Nakamurella sp. UYEF19]|uniref:Clp protease N-terminal domain-containing protein n=1 Tax=Nakamurella sp. UYEF19 TaxID=1756392 RepID=UPI0033937C7B
MFERFSHEARTVVVLAQEEARTTREPNIGTHHLLIGLAGPGDDTASRALRAVGLDAATVRRHHTMSAGRALDGSALAGLGIDLETVRRAAEERFGAGALDAPPGRRRLQGHIPLSFGAKQSLELALRSAVALQSSEISTGHLLLGIIDEGRDRGAGLLRDCGIDLTSLRAGVVALLTPRAA